MATVLALDLSLSRTGICANGELSSYTPPKGARLDRARAIALHVGIYAVSADLIVVEAIGTRMIDTAIALATVHALVFDRIGTDKVQMVTPADLKKFATGKGNADKASVMLAAAKLEPTVSNDDEGDAWWLWAIGSWLTGDVFIESAYRHAVIEKIHNRSLTVVT